MTQKLPKSSKDAMRMAKRLAKLNGQPTPMRVIIAGSRHIDDYMLVSDAMKECGFNVAEVVCGCAPGVDENGKVWARSKGLPVSFFPADWGKHGSRAGPIRNREMANYAKALVLIWDGKSPGSASMLFEAKKRNLKIYEKIVKCTYTPIQSIVHPAATQSLSTTECGSVDAAIAANVVKN